MPYSSPEGKAEGLAFVKKHCPNPGVIVDIGAGSGTYAKLWKSELGGEWGAAEPYLPYWKQFNLPELYNFASDQTGTEFLEKSNTSYDLVILGDVIEHLDDASAKELLGLCFQKSRFTLISTPAKPYHQCEAEIQQYVVPNPLERHQHICLPKERIIELAGGREPIEYWEGGLIGVTLFKGDV